MCGIAGLFPRIESTKIGAQLWRMADSVRHRGPDNVKVVIGNHRQGFSSTVDTSGSHLPSLWGLGHARLSIIDLSEDGCQPMRDPEGTCWISYCGEVYNYVELREELRSEGFCFYTNTDTEVALASYKKWGFDCVKKFEGMFAFIIVDLGRELVYIARDRFGIKPLYFWNYCGVTAVVSEIKQLQVVKGFKPRIDTQQAVDFVVDGLLDYDPKRCMIKEVTPLPPAHRLSWRLGKEPNIDSATLYWEPPSDIRNKLTWNDAAHEFRHLFQNSVRSRLRSDVPVGSCLSGGVDSTLIVAMAREYTGEKFHTISSCFDDPKYDEQYYIDIVNRHCKTTPFKIFANETELIQDFEKVLYHQDLPFASASIYAQYEVMRAAKRAGVVVLLDGQGCDEIFCGYKKYFFFYLRDMLHKGKFYAATKHLLNSIKAGDNNLFTFNNGARRYMPALLRLRGGVPSYIFNDKYRSMERFVWLDKMGGAKDLFQHRLGDLMWWSLPVLLRYEDRNSMAHSVETRLPFLDHKIVEFALTLPHEMFFVKGRTKRLLVEAVGGIIPPEVRDRKTKMGFEAPVDIWMKNLFGRYLMESLLTSNRMAEIINIAKLRKDMNKYINGQLADSSNWLFRAACLVRWGDLFNIEVGA